MCWNEWKIIFQIFIFWVSVIFVLKMVNHNSKNKIGKNMIFHSFQHIAHLSCIDRWPLLRMGTAYPYLGQGLNFLLSSSTLRKFISQSLTCSELVLIVLVSWHISLLTFDHGKLYLFKNILWKCVHFAGTSITINYDMFLFLTEFLSVYSFI